LQKIRHADRMKNRISKSLEKQVLADVDKETLDGINHFLNDFEKMYNAYKMMSYVENPKKLDDDWNSDWGEKPRA
jgi:hypothetical protein